MRAIFVLIFFSYKLFPQLISDKILYLDNKLKTAVNVFNKNKKGKLVSVGTLQFNKDSSYFYFTSGNSEVRLKGAFKNQWYLVRSVANNFLEIYINDSLNKTIYLAHNNAADFSAIDKGASFFVNNTKYFFQEYNSWPVFTTDPATVKLFERPDDKSPFVQDKIRFQNFKVLEVKNNWFKVKVSDFNFSAGKTNEGWIKWVGDNGVLVKLYW